MVWPSRAASSWCPTMDDICFFSLSFQSEHSRIIPPFPPISNWNRCHLYSIVDRVRSWSSFSFADSTSIVGKDGWITVLIGDGRLKYQGASWLKRLTHSSGTGPIGWFPRANESLISEYDKMLDNVDSARKNILTQHLPLAAFTQRFSTPLVPGIPGAGKIKKFWFETDDAMSVYPILKPGNCGRTFCLGIVGFIASIDRARTWPAKNGKERSWKTKTRSCQIWKKQQFPVQRTCVTHACTGILWDISDLLQNRLQESERLPEKQRWSSILSAMCARTKRRILKTLREK